MTDEKKPDVTPQGNAPSWVDEVLGSSKATPAPSPAASTPAAPRPSTPTPAGGTPLSGPQDLKIPDSRPAAPPPPPASGDDWVARATGGTVKNPQMPTGPDVTPRPTQSTSEVLSDFMRPIVSELNSKTAPRPAPPIVPGAAADPVQARPVDTWGDPAQQPAPYRPQNQVPYTGGDVSQKKLIAGLLAIFLGSFGVHKFYLGMNNPGLLMLGVNVGVWVLAVLLSIVTLGIGAFLTLPLAGLVSSVIGILGLIEGILYLTKSDADFQREYLIGKKPWL